MLDGIDGKWVVESQEQLNKGDFINTEKGLYVVDTKFCHFDPDSPQIYWGITAITSGEYLEKLKEAEAR